MQTGYDYDLISIGSGPAGHRAAIRAAKLGRRAAVCELRADIGGICINTGTIPSKTLREAVLHLSGYRERAIYGASYVVKKNITMRDLLFRSDHVVRNEVDVACHQLQRNGIEILPARASFTGPHSLRLNYVDGRGQRDVSADKIVIAVGTETTRPTDMPFDRQRLFTSDDILTLSELPHTLAVVGAGVIGLEYATIFAALGVRVTLIDKRHRLLDFVDYEITDALAYQMRQNRVTLRLGEEVSGIELYEDERGPHVCIHLASDKQIIAEKALYSVGRTGATGSLGLDTAGLAAGKRGLIEVDSAFQTRVPHIYAVGDVIGFPSLAVTSMEQGRLAACHAFGVNAHSMRELHPYGIYTIPEISMVGRTEEQLTEAGVPYETGGRPIARSRAARSSATRPGC